MSLHRKMQAHFLFLEGRGTGCLWKIHAKKQEMNILGQEIYLHRKFAVP